MTPHEAETVNHARTDPPKSKSAGNIICVAAILTGLCLLLAPSGWFAWKFKTMPQLGSYHDDALLWLSARSLAQNDGYRIPHLPERPAQTKYPPVYPAVLSLIWRFAGAFPENLAALMALQWSFYPVFVGLVWTYLWKSGFSPPAAFALAAIPALCPITILLGTLPLTEIPFCVLLLALMLLLEIKSPVLNRTLSETGLGLLAGTLAALAFLVRTNAIVLVVSVPLVLILQRRVRVALAFAAPLAAAIIGWQGWCFRNASRATDDAISYYTSYVGFYVRTFSWADLPHRAWVNLAALIESLARLVIFTIDSPLWVRMLGWLVSAIAISGIVTLYRRGHRHYPIFAALLVVTLIFWQYPPDTRFVFPLFPLYVAGLATKLHQVADLARATWRDKRGADRIAVVVTFSFMFLLAAASLVSILNGVFSVLPQYFAERETERSEMAPVYGWISSHTSPEDRFASYDDPMLYLNTGRQGYTEPLLPRLVYDQDSNEVERYIKGLDTFWSEKKVVYVLVSKYDFRRDLHEPALESLREMVRDRSRFDPLYSDATAQVYRFEKKSRLIGSAP